MRRPAQGVSESSVPPSPMPVRLASVSITTTMLLCSSGIWSGITLGPSKKRIRVILAAGRAACVTVGQNNADADAAAEDLRKVRRFIGGGVIDLNSKPDAGTPQAKASQ